MPVFVTPTLSAATLEPVSASSARRTAESGLLFTRAPFPPFSTHPSPLHSWSTAQTLV